MKVLLPRLRTVSTSISLMLGVIPVISGATVINPAVESAMVPTGKGWAVETTNAPPALTNSSIPQNGIQFHGGPVMGTTASTIPNIYYIWYGNWAGNTGKYILTKLALGMGITSYYNINSTYQDANGQPVQRRVNFPHYGVNDNYSQGTSLSDSAIAAVVSNAITSNQLPLDSNGIYFVLTSADVKVPSGFCTSYCGWHTYMTFNNTNIKYSFVGDPSTQCPNACAAQSKGPNDNMGADAMASVIAHELEETVTDPNLNAWYDVNGAENADKCAWNFGTTKTAPNGAQYNVTIGDLHFLIQQNWLNANNGSCAISF